MLTLKIVEFVNYGFQFLVFTIKLSHIQVKLNTMYITTTPLLLTFICFCSESLGLSVDPNCDYYQEIQMGKQYFIYNNEYPNNYKPSTACRWSARSPERTVMVLSCNDLNVPASQNCQDDRLLFGLTGDENLENVQTFCGSNIFSTYSQSNRLSVGLIASEYSRGGKFLCSLAAMRLPQTSCSCGLKEETKIIGGTETGVNEYPSMAALVDLSTTDAFCGASLIADMYALTAAHCLLNNEVNNVALLVGDHDLNSGTDTPTSALYSLQAFYPHPSYDSSTEHNDIAVLKTQKRIQLSAAVFPVCLPFYYGGSSFENQQVTALGWGFTDVSGNKADTLQQVDLNVVSNRDCQASMTRNEILMTQICTYAPGKDSCLSDSGGPLLWNGGKLELVGIISYGIGCATSRPAVNTRVTSYLAWIVSICNDVSFCIQ